MLGPLLNTCIYMYYLFTSHKKMEVKIVWVVQHHSWQRTCPRTQAFCLMPCWCYFPHSILETCDLSEVFTIFFFEWMKILEVQLLLTGNIIFDLFSKSSIWWKLDLFYFIFQYRLDCQLCEQIPTSLHSVLIFEAKMLKLKYTFYRKKNIIIKCNKAVK